MAQPDWNSLIQQFDGSGVNALVLMGSYARGDAGPFSDVDLLRLIGEETSDLTNNLTGEGSYLIDDRLVTLSNADPAQVDAWFTEPNLAVSVVASLRDAQVLVERENAFAKVKERADTFVWDEAMQTKANAYASQEMVGWIEEAHKGLEGLRRMDIEEINIEQEVIGRLLNARFGLTHGLSHVVQVQHGIATNSDNAFYADVAEAVGLDSAWSRVRTVAFGVGLDGRTPTLREQVEAGLLLYVETAQLLRKAILPQHKPLIQRTVERINDYW
ncbi:MAG: nucleotidyltransferase domain-containing protein [Chloroflexota bacterium]